MPSGAPALLPTAFHLLRPGVQQKGWFSKLPLEPTGARGARGSNGLGCSPLWLSCMLSAQETLPGKPGPGPWGSVEGAPTPKGPASQGGCWGVAHSSTGPAPHSLKLGSSGFPRGDLGQVERSVGRLRTMHSKMLLDIEKVQIHFGGSVKASSQMIHELLQAQCLSSPCYKRWAAGLGPGAWHQGGQRVCVCVCRVGQRGGQRVCVSVCVCVCVEWGTREGSVCPCVCM